jgi:hypothetical protein
MCVAHMRAVMGNWNSEIRSAFARSHLCWCMRASNPWKGRGAFSGMGRWRPGWGIPGSERCARHSQTWAKRLYGFVIFVMLSEKIEYRIIQWIGAKICLHVGVELPGRLEKTAGTLHEDHDGASHNPFYHWSVAAHFWVSLGVVFLANWFCLA